MTPFGPERLEERTLMTALSPAVVQALIAPANDANQTGGGLAVLQEWAGALSQSGMYNQTLPIVDESVGQLLDLGQQVGSQIDGPASTYLTGTASPTGEGLLAAILAGDHLAGGSFSSTGGVDTFTLPTLKFSTTASLPIDLGHDASLLNIAVDASARVNVTTVLTLNVAFSVNTTTDQFSVAIKPSTPSAALSVPNLNVGVSIGLLGGPITAGSLGLTAGRDFQTAGATGVTVAQLFGGEANPDGILTTSVDASTGLNASLPMAFSLNDQSLTSNPLPTVTVADPHPFDGTAPTITTANFGNLINFSDIGPSRLLSLIENLGSTFGQLSTSSFLATPIPFADTTVGGALDFGAAFAAKLTDGLKTIPAPTAAPGVAPTEGGATGGQLAAGTYFAEFTFVTAQGESAPSPVSTTFTVASGQIPRITLPAAPSGQTIYLYLSDSDTPPSTPALTVTALDPLDATNTLSLADSTHGQLNADLYFQVALDGGSPATIHVPQAATAGNTSVVNLVAEINTALTTDLGAGAVQATATDDGTTSRIAFALAPRTRPTPPSWPITSSRPSTPTSAACSTSPTSASPTSPPASSRPCRASVHTPRSASSTTSCRSSTRAWSTWWTTGRSSPPHSPTCKPTRTGRCRPTATRSPRPSARRRARWP